MTPSADAIRARAVGLWRYDDGSWREDFHDDGKVSPLTRHVALPVLDHAALIEAVERAERVEKAAMALLDSRDSDCLAAALREALGDGGR